MPNFDRFINTDINTTPFQLVTFGKDAPLLEVELNEAQYIMYNKLRLIAKRIIGDIFDGTMTVSKSNSQLLINGVFCVDGHIINCDNISIPISANKMYYMNINVKSVTGSTVIRKNGYTGGDTIDNTIIDNRIGETTTGRKSIEFSISTNEDMHADSSVFIFSTNNSLDVQKVQFRKITNELSRLGTGIQFNEAKIQKVDNKLTTNLLKPTLGTTTQDGVTCTNNGDGTYTLNGTSTINTFFPVGVFTFKANVNYRMVGCPSGGEYSNKYAMYFDAYSDKFIDFGIGKSFTFTQDTKITISIVVRKDYAMPNVLFKPMITTNLNATYEDFVPYTGSTGQLNSDVAEVRKDFDEHTHTKSQITDFPTKVSSFQNDSNYQTDRDVTNAIDSIEIGGRNLLFNSNFEFPGKTNWTNLSEYVCITNEGRNGGYCIKQIGEFNKDRTTFNSAGNKSNNIKIKANDTFTFSGWYKVQNYVAGTTNNFVRPYVFYYKSDGSLVTGEAILDISPDATDWTYVKATFKVPNISTIDYMIFSLYARDYTGIIWWDDIKLENGNKATPWTPAIEDTEAEINALTSRVNTIENKLGITLTSTLSTGDTVVTFTHSAIKETSMFDIYTDIYNTNPKYIDVTIDNDTNKGTLTIVFKPQYKDMSVKVVIK